MKIVKALPDRYHAIQFDVSFVKKYGLIKYPMVELTTQKDGNGPIVKYSKRTRDDFWNHIFGMKETVKHEENQTQNIFILRDCKSGNAVAIKDGYWIVTDRFGKSKVYSPKKFMDNFESTLLDEEEA